jgi:hypothetical protein
MTRKLAKLVVAKKFRVFRDFLVVSDYLSPIGAGLLKV